MAEQEYRIERDSMGEVKVPKKAYYGAQTQRAVENFPVSGIGFPPAHQPPTLPALNNSAVECSERGHAPLC